MKLNDEYDVIINDIDNNMNGITRIDNLVVFVPCALKDEKVIKEVHFDVVPEQIIIDNNNKIAYVSAGSNSSIYILNLETMTLKKQLKMFTTLKICAWIWKNVDHFVKSSEFENYLSIIKRKKL